MRRNLPVGRAAALAVVDVLLPVRDAAETLPDALESLQAQTLADFRCLILDDGSGDDSASIAGRVAASDPRFVLHRFGPRGLVPTLNDGLDRVEAPFLARLDADDRAEPERLARQVDFLDRSPEVHVVSCWVDFFGENLSDDLLAYCRWLNSVNTHEEIVRDLFVESPLPHPTVVFRSASLRGLDGYRTGPFPEDYDLWLRAWIAGWKFAKIGEVLVHVRDHARRLTRTDPRYSPRAFLECKTEHLVAAWGLEGDDVVVWGAGRDGKRAAKALRRRGVNVRHLIDVAPTKVGRRMIGLEVLPAESLAVKPGCRVVVSVGVKGARARIRKALGAWGYREGEEFVCFG